MKKKPSPCRFEVSRILDAATAEALAGLRHFTMGQVARVAGVAPRTASKWFDSGKLKGFRIPGSNDRRVPRESLVRFLKEHGLPLGPLRDTPVLLLVSPDPALAGKLQGNLGEAWSVRQAATAFEAGLSLAGEHPDAVLADFAAGAAECRSLLKACLARPLPPLACALATEDVGAAGLAAEGWLEAWDCPCPVAAVASWLEEALTARRWRP